jgi:Na+(H+)/acetate symporter ActP
MEAKVIRFPVKEAARDLTLKVKLTGMRAFTWRVSIGAVIMAFGAAVMGIRFEVKRGD